MRKLLALAALAALPLAAQDPTPAPSPTPAPTPAVDEARKALEAAVADVNAKVDAWKTKEARDAAKALEAQAASDPGAALALGRLLDQERKYDDAARSLQKAAELAPADPWPLLALGETLLRAGKGADAEAAFQKAADAASAVVAADPKDASGWRAQGIAQRRLKKAADAAASLEKAREIDGGAPDTLYALGVVRTVQQRWGDAVDVLTKAVEKSSGMALAYYYRGLAYEKLGKKDLMLLDFDRLVKLAPASPEADRARAVLKASKR